jgi:hypothetical protein
MLLTLGGLGFCLSRYALAGSLVLEIPSCDTPVLELQSGTYVLTCSAAPAPPPTDCTDIVFKNASGTTITSLTGSGTVTATATCGGTPSSYAWTLDGTPISGVGKVVTQQLTADASGDKGYVFKVTPTYDGQPGGARTETFTVKPAPESPPSPTSCSGVDHEYVVLPVGDSVVSTRFDLDTMLVAELNTAGVSTAGGSAGVVDLIEFNDPKATREAWLSTTPCGTYGDSNTVWKTSRQGKPTLYYSVGNSSSTTGAALLQPNKRYYYNIRNRTWLGTSDCPAGGTCNVRLTHKLPN